ncbi:peptidase S8/S53 domain-containing protein [Chytriomyces cf. hyalinus JEL632]|nr:peptidase S8/S53 domain-containing protein [Chytriomyces cf. hyalinus JEL632]
MQALHALAWLSLSMATASASWANAPPNDHENFAYFAYQIHGDTSTADSSARARRDLAHEASPFAQRAANVALWLGQDSLSRRSESACADLSAPTVVFIGAVGELPNYFQVAVRRDSVELMNSVQECIRTHPDVAWAEMQVPKNRLVKRSVPEVWEDDLHLWGRGNEGRIEAAAKLFEITDPEFGNQWHLINDSPSQVGNDHNVTGAWSQGIFGNGSVVCFVDDGMNYNSNDLKDNYYAEGSYDYNAHTPDPIPKTYEDRHGTRCAGEVAAVRNNVCGVGVAYKAKVSAVRILGGSLTEADEAASINYKMQDNHIYSCSWGPTDNGATMEAPPRIVSDAVVNGIKNGRGGLGSIFVFASGNGGAAGDNCNFDGYTNSIYTITVSSVDRNNLHPVYSEACSANMIVMYSSANQRHDDAIATTDWQLGHEGDLCTKSHGGTSASAPLASGIYALVNSIRPDLSWRDYQHITVRSAVPVNTKDPSWFKTHAGRLYSHEYGYGKLDAYAILELAKTWKTVPAHAFYKTAFVAPNEKGAAEIPQESGKDVRAIYDITRDALAEANFGLLEHITVTINIQHKKRGDVAVDLISPNGIMSFLGVKRHGDRSDTGYSNWTFMTVAHWDENPVGRWQLVIRDAETPDLTGTFENAAITFWGSQQTSTVHKKPDVVGGGAEPPTVPVPTDASAQPADASKTSNTPSGAIGEDGKGDTAQPSNSGGRSGVAWFIALIVICGLGGAGWYLYSKRTEIFEWFLMRQQRMNDNEMGATGVGGSGESYEFQRLNREVGERDESSSSSLDEFEDFEGPNDAELEELRKGGYLVDDLLFDDTQASNL